MTRASQPCRECLFAPKPNYTSPNRGELAALPPGLTMTGPSVVSKARVFGAGSHGHRSQVGYSFIGLHRVGHD